MNRFNRAEILRDGQIQLREEKIIIDQDGNEHVIGFHRRVIDVGDDVSGEDQIVKDIAANLHTPERIAARAAAKAKSIN